MPIEVRMPGVAPGKEMIGLSCAAGTNHRAADSLRTNMKLSMKQQLRGIIGALMLFLCVAVVFWGLLPTIDGYRRSRNLATANEISDAVLTASADLALERGITTTALSALSHAKQLPPD